MSTLPVYTLTWLMCMFCSIATFYAVYLSILLTFQKRNFLKWQLPREILSEARALTSASYVARCFPTEGVLALERNTMPVAALEEMSSFSVIVHGANQMSSTKL